MSLANLFNRGWVIVIACVICGSGCAAFRQPASMGQAVTRAPARVTLKGLDRTYDGKSKPAQAATTPGGLTMSITYDGKDKAPVNAGSYKVVATVQDANYEGSATGTLTIAKAPQKIMFDALTARTYGDGPFDLSAGISGGLIPAYASSNLKVATIKGSQVTIVGAGTVIITASQAGDSNHLAAVSLQRTLTVKKATAMVTLGGIEQAYDGKPKPAAGKTAPAGLTMSITYDGSNKAPVNAGRYKVVATVQDANYEGSATGTLTIAKAPQKITFDALTAKTYGDRPIELSAGISGGLIPAYASSDLKVATIKGNQVTIVGAGTVIITASQAGDSNHLAAESVQQSFTVKKAPVKVTLGGLEQAYDGKPKPAAGKTEQSGLTVSITYDGSNKAPVNAGSYKVVAAVQDANYEGSAAGTLTIAKAPQKITFDALTAKTYGDRPIELSANLSSGLTATFESSNPAVAIVSGSRVTAVGAGTVIITASQAGDSNHLAAESIQQSLTVKKAPAKVTLGGLEQTYDGKPKPAAGKTAPAGLAVSITYDGSDKAPVNAGRYKVAAVVQDANYEGSAAGTITIAKAAQRISFNPLPARPYSEAPFILEATVSSSLTIAYESSNAAVATVRGNQVTIRGIGTTTITASQSGDDNHPAAAPVQQTLTVEKAPAKVTLGVLKQVYDGKPKQATSRTYPAGLAVRITYDGGDKAPVNAGSYTVAATVHDAKYEGIAIETLTIAKAVQRITFNTLSTRTYGDETPYLLFAAASSGLAVAYGSSDPTVATISGNEVKLTGAGKTTVTAYQPGDINFLAGEPVQQTLTVKKAPETVTLGGLEQTYDGKPKPATGMTSPAGLAVSITYDGSDKAPVNAGRYKVVAAVQDANYEGSASGTMSIAKASQKIILPILDARTHGDGPFDLPAIASSGLIPAYESSDPAVASVSGKQVTINGAGTTTIIAYQPGDRNYQAAEPVKRVLVVLAKKRHIVVLPLENLSRKPAPLKEIRQSLIDELIKQGDSVSVLEEGSLERFMARHRVRYIGGVDTATARAWKEEEGIDTVLVASVDQYDDTDTPKIALTARLVSTGEMPHILWMENVDLSGDDSPGLFGSGLIENIGALQHKALKQLAASLAGLYSDRSVPGNRSKAKLFRPKVAFHSSFSMVPDETYTVAVMPFYNRSESFKASDILALRFVSQLVKSKRFQVLDPGVVRQKLLNFRVIMPYGISRKDADSFFNNVETDLIVMGRVMEYQERNPKIEFSVQIYERTSRAMIWSSWSHNQGDDGVVFFDAGRINNVGVLVSKMIKNIVRDMTSE